MLPPPPAVAAAAANALALLLNTPLWRMDIAPPPLLFGASWDGRRLRVMPPGPRAVRGATVSTRAVLQHSSGGDSKTGSVRQPCMCMSLCVLPMPCLSGMCVCVCAATMMATMLRLPLNDGITTIRQRPSPVLNNTPPHTHTHISHLTHPALDFAPAATRNAGERLPHAAETWHGLFGQRRGCITALLAQRTSATRCTTTTT